MRDYNFENKYNFRELVFTFFVGGVIGIIIGVMI